MKSETFHLLISGQVQGVGYRASLQREANARHINGWVRNRSDGRVEALISGPSFAIESLLDWTRQGPPAAVVEQVEVMQSTASTTPGFHLHPTL